MHKWLMHDDQQELFNALFALALNGIFLALVALVMWPLGKLPLASTLARGFGGLWIALIVSSLLLTAVQRLLRVDLDSRYTSYVISTLVVSTLLQVGWTAFAAQTAHAFSAGAAIRLGAVIYLLAFLSCWIASQVIAVSFAGQIYKVVNLALIPIAFAIFSLWPAGAQMLFGWLP